MVYKVVMHFVMLKSLIPALVASLLAPLLYLSTLANNASVLTLDVLVLALDASTQAFKASPI